MNPCDQCGSDIYPSNGERVCRLCERGIVAFEPGRIVYRSEEAAQRDAAQRKGRAYRVI
jgi:uncharacterized Zn finger protein (UPF0148 family)